MFYREHNPNFTPVDSVTESLRFATRRCLDEFGGNLCANSTFVDPMGEPARWHYFGEIEGPGWAANCAGGAAEMLRYARAFGVPRLRAIGLSLLYHVLEGGFIGEDGLIRGYRHIPTGRRFLNYMCEDRRDVWLCPGANAMIALQLLWASDESPEPLKTRLANAALRIAGWLRGRVKPCANGWYPRRCGPDGQSYPFNAYGSGEDPQFDHSGDGAYLLWLWIELTGRGMEDLRREIRRAADAFRAMGGAFGSINHDTYDDHENVSYSVSFHALRRAARLLGDDSLLEWARGRCLQGLRYFEMRENRNGVETRGLLFMEDSWNTSYMWENAEAAQAWFESAADTGSREEELKGLTILRAAALHHHGPHGFLTEGVDWNNHNHQWRIVDGVKIPIHVGGVVYGDVNYTQPFLNNMHTATPALFYLERLARRRRAGRGTIFLDCEDNELASNLNF